MLSSVYCCGYFFRVCLEYLAFQTALLFFSLSVSLVFVRGASALRPNSGGGGGGGFILVNSSDTRLRLTFAASFIPGI